MFQDQHQRHVQNVLKNPVRFDCTISQKYSGYICICKQYLGLEILILVVLCIKHGNASDQLPYTILRHSNMVPTAIQQLAFLFFSSAVSCSNKFIHLSVHIKNTVIGSKNLNDWKCSLLTFIQQPVSTQLQRTFFYTTSLLAIATIIPINSSAQFPLLLCSSSSHCRPKPFYCYYMILTASVEKSANPSSIEASKIYDYCQATKTSLLFTCCRVFGSIVKKFDSIHKHASGSVKEIK